MSTITSWLACSRSTPFGPAGSVVTTKRNPLTSQNQRVARTNLDSAPSAFGAACTKPKAIERRRMLGRAGCASFVGVILPQIAAFVIRLFRRTHHRSRASSYAKGFFPVLLLELCFADSVMAGRRKGLWFSDVCVDWSMFLCCRFCTYDSARVVFVACTRIFVARHWLLIDCRHSDGLFHVTLLPYHILVRSIHRL